MSLCIRVSLYTCLSVYVSDLLSLSLPSAATGTGFGGHHSGVVLSIAPPLEAVTAKVGGRRPGALKEPLNCLSQDEVFF